MNRRATPRVALVRLALPRLAFALAVALGPTSMTAQEGQAGGLGPAVASFSVLDVGQGDAILIRSPEGKTALIDAGPSHHVVDLLRERGVASLDLLAISHHHQDHFGGAEAVVQAFKPRVFLASDSAHTSPHYLRLLELVRDLGIRAIGPTAAPRKVELGSVALTVFPKAPEDDKEENNNSICIRAQVGRFALLLPGDAERPEREWWMANVPGLCANCDVLKLAHHGSKNGTDFRWLALVRPRLAIGSMGRGNEFGHPHPATLALLARARMPLLRTDQAGTITVTTDGKRWEVASHGREADGPGPAEVGGGEAARPRGEVMAPARGSLLNLNTATLAELESLPGIGPVLARRIAEARPFRSVDDLARVKGIGPRKLEEVRRLVRAE